MNDHWAAQQLASMYAYGKYGVPIDSARARPWCERAARQGDPWSMYCLGSGYHTGWGGERDPQKALHWLLKAAERGVAGAQYDLGWMYWTGHGVSWNALNALKWWMRAASQGDRPAQRRVFTVAVGPALVLLLLGAWGAVRHRRRSKAG
jgi:TPR repeat protein